LNTLGEDLVVCDPQSVLGRGLCEFGVVAQQLEYLRLKMGELISNDILQNLRHTLHQTKETVKDYRDLVCQVNQKSAALTEKALAYDFLLGKSTGLVSELDTSLLDLLCLYFKTQQVYFKKGSKCMGKLSSGLESYQAYVKVTNYLPLPLPLPLLIYSLAIPREGA
jgi:hypothetical protein